jgi:hypothetical protein
MLLLNTGFEPITTQNAENRNGAFFYKTNFNNSDFQQSSYQNNNYSTDNNTNHGKTINNSNVFDAEYTEKK